MNSVTVGNYSCGPGQPLLLIAGPCVLQSVDLALEIAEPLARLNERSDVNVVFKASFDKANRTSLNAERGPGLEAGLRMMEDIARM
ncbi:MAG: 3-deoxy-8-phosphooctulonate synthase, partial [Rubripirellula sp.]